MIRAVISGYINVITDVTEGDKIRLQFEALPHREYGELIGEITKIGVEPIIKEAIGQVFS
ncbi:MAG: hypothetical protein ACLKAK_00010 [Alkaliphilus sp.]